jgi:hypothetical protein
LSLKEKIASANTESFTRMVESEPTLVEVGPVSKLLPRLRKKTILHAGPPISWEKMCGPMRSGVAGAAIYEGWAEDFAGADKLLREGTIRLEPCHEHSSVGSMTGVTSPSMWAFAVRDTKYGSKSYSHLYEGRGNTLAFGGFSPETLARLKWLEETLGPSLHDSLKTVGEVPLRTIISEGLQMGDECHNRNVACSQIFFLKLCEGFHDLDAKTFKQVKDYMVGARSNFFLTTAMAACKAMSNAASNVPLSTVVTVMSRNGVEFGIEVSGLGERWFLGPAQKINGLYFPGFTEKDANRDMGDSAITESVGLGGFAMAASPPMLLLVGLTPEEAVHFADQMYGITTGVHKYFRIPNLGFKGTPVGVDIRKVVKTRVLPIINTGISHREPGIGQIGAGLVNPPMEPFEAALKEFANRNL